MKQHEEHILKAWEDRELLKNPATVKLIEECIEAIDKGELRCAEKVDGEWQVHEWVKKAVILYFPTRKMESLEGIRIL